ncbi:MAG: DEAD/DEAH box helicase, partial [Myroides sp.]
MNYHSKSTNILLNLGIEELNEMQLAANETILNKNETLLLSPTGSGKTLAFLYPLYQLIDPDAKGIQALILVPSRELGLQIEQ